MFEQRRAGNIPSLRRQRGQLIILLLMVLVVAGSIGFMTFYGPASRQIAAGRIDAEVMAQAMDALIGRAVSDDNRPGSLPCPDTDNDGEENLGVSPSTECASYLGRLPWMTLGLPDVRDSSGERLWYAVSPSFRNHPSVSPLNSGTAGELELEIAGINPAKQVAAIIIAPGFALSNQLRDVANPNTPANYLEGVNNNGDLKYISAAPSDNFNDRLLALTTDKLFHTVAARVAQEVRLFLSEYRASSGYYPFANNYVDGTPYPCEDGLSEGRIPLVIQSGCGSLQEWPIGTPPEWFYSNNWHLFTHYAMDNACSMQVTGFTNTACIVVIVTGRTLVSCTNAASCLDDPENASGTGVFVKPKRFPEGNDRMAVSAISCLAGPPCPTAP